MTRHYTLFRIILAIILLLITGCASRVPSPTALPVTPTASSTPVRLLPTPTTASTPLASTLTPTPTETPEAANPTYQRPTFDYADPTQLQILAQWSTGLVESHYIWSPDGSRLLLVSAPATRLIDVQTFQQLWEAPGGTEGAFSQDGNWVSIRNVDATQVYSTTNGQPDRSGQPFSAAASDPMTQPVKSFIENYDPLTARPFNKNLIYWLALAVQEDGTHRELRFFYHEKPCPTTHYTQLPPGITGYSVSPDNRLILITAQGTGVERNYQAVILGLNSGFEVPLPNHIQDLSQPGFHPNRPSLGITQRLPILYSPLNGQNFYPSPIDPPTGPMEAYRLKPWDAEAGLAMLKPLVEYATANDVFGPASGRGSFFEAQEPLRMAALEYLSRFPQSPYREIAQWRLAMTNSILSNNETDGWIAAQLEQALNQQGLALEPLSLNAALAPFGLYVDASPFPPLKTPGWAETTCDFKNLPPNSLLANNLFGDGRSSQILIVKTSGSSVGMVIAVHQDAGEQYHVVPVAGQWGLYEGVFQEIDVVDVTGDGHPEIRVDFYWHNGSMNGSVTRFYQWQGRSVTEGKFVELTGGIEFDTGGHIPELDILGGPGVPKTLVAHKHGVLVFDAIQTLKWDGQRFVSSTRIPLSTEPDLMDVQEALLKALYNGQAEEIITQMRSLPTDPWRTFLLGYVEALQFHPGHARAALQPLADQAKTDPGNGLANAASAFLAVYQNGMDLYRACRAAHQASQDAPCGTDLAFQSLLDHLSSQPVSDLPGVLEGLGVNLFYQVQQDFNGDGRNDWLLAEEYAYGDNLLPYQSSKMWLVISKTGGFEVQPLDDIPPSSTTPLSLTSVQLQYGTSRKLVQVFLLKADAGGRAGGQFFRVRQKGEQWVIDHLLDEWNVSEYQIVEDGSALVIFHNTENFSLPELAQWNLQTGRYEKSDYLEYLLLMKGRADEALQLIPGLLDQVMLHPGQDGYNLALYGSRLQYLLGLAYELSGDSKNAVRVYYNLWKSHPVPTLDPEYLGQPDQPYAIMAREKLEQMNK